MDDAAYLCDYSSLQVLISKPEMPLVFHLPQQSPDSLYPQTLRDLSAKSPVVELDLQGQEQSYLHC